MTIDRLRSGLLRRSPIVLWFPFGATRRWLTSRCRSVGAPMSLASPGFWSQDCEARRITSRIRKIIAWVEAVSLTRG
jgi:hypothetical protein